MKISGIGFDDFGKVFIRGQSYYYWPYTYDADKTAVNEVDDVLFEDDVAKILIQGKWHVVEYDGYNIKIGGKIINYSICWKDGKLYRKNSPRHTFYFGDYMILATNVELAIPMTGDYVFGVIDGQVVAVDRYTGAKVASFYWKSYSIPKIASTTLLLEMAHWNINCLGLLVIGYFPKSEHVVELPLNAVVSEISKGILQINEMVIGFNTSAGRMYNLTTGEPLFNGIMDEISTIYGTFKKISGEGNSTTFDVCNTSVTKNKIGNIEIGEIIRPVGKNTKPALKFDIDS